MGRILVLLYSTILLSCQTDNSNSFDDILGQSTIDPNNTNLVNAYSVLEESCINCHSGYHNDWASYDTDQKWIDAGLVTAGIIGDSTVITRLKNRGSDMPKNQAALSEDDYNTLVTWIEAL